MRLVDLRYIFVVSGAQSALKGLQEIVQILLADNWVELEQYHSMKLLLLGTYSIAVCTLYMHTALYHLYVRNKLL